MAREFIVSNNGPSTVTGSATLAFINPASAPNPSIEFLRFWVGQSASATSAQQTVRIVTQVSSYPNGMTGITPAKLKTADPNASVITSNTSGPMGSAGVNATAENGGTKTIILTDAFNVLNGWLHVPTPAETIIVPANVSATGHGLGLFFPSAPTTTTGWQWGVTYRELG
jgi:hypothetical protein